MIPFHTVCPDVAQKETRSVTVGASPGLPAGEYAFVELFCDEPGCDCRRVLLQVWSRARAGEPVAHIAFGWEERAFYEKWSVMPRDLARKMARETTEGALDPLNPQSQCAPALLRVFREMIALDGEYAGRLKRHYDLFRQTLSTTGNPQDELSQPKPRRPRAPTSGFAQ
jgi:hypothetical protein